MDKKLAVAVICVKRQIVKKPALDARTNISVWLRNGQ
jgi:hypothetical protein